jgi:hypothetical protein
MEGIVGDVIGLHGPRIDLASEEGHQWVIDCCRAGENLLSDAELSEKWDLNDADWIAIRKDKALERAVRLERERRVRTGQAVKEAAARHLVKGVGIVDEIMSSADSHPKHKLDAFRELRSTAAVGADAEGRPGTELFVIKIDLSAGGGPVETYEKTISIDTPSEGKPDADDQW